MSASEDAGERWYQLIRADSDLKLIAMSLRTRADHLRAESKLRKWSGPQNARARQMFRTEADECVTVAIRAEFMIPRDLPDGSLAAERARVALEWNLPVGADVSLKG